jgi:PPM family protein phosphatase
MKIPSKGTYAYKTDIGRVRVDNEDQALAMVNASGEVLLVVCDGMGGQNRGDYASKMAIDVMSEAFRKKKPHRLVILDRLWFTKTAREANSLIYNEADKNPVYKGMGTTLVAALLRGDKLIVANIGDSRAYLSDAKGLRQITEDQTYVRYLVSTGKITEEEAEKHPDRHVLMNALGIYPSVSLTLNVLPYQNESVLLCSDGLYNSVPLTEIQAVISTDERADQKAMSLINEANSNGGSDNSAVAYWEAIKHD